MRLLSNLVLAASGSDFVPSTLLAGGDATGGAFGKATVAAVRFFNAIRVLAVTCGVAAAVCAVVLVAILLSTSTNPMERSRLKMRIGGIAIACAVLTASSTILAIMANIGASW